MVSGPGVTPFGIPQQTVLINSMAAQMTTVTKPDFLVRYVTSQDPGQTRRRLLMDGNRVRHLTEMGGAIRSVGRKFIKRSLKLGLHSVMASCIEHVPFFRPGLGDPVCLRAAHVLLNMLQAARPAEW